jgi:gas vesicle protein
LIECGGIVLNLVKFEPKSFILPGSFISFSRNTLTCSKEINFISMSKTTSTVLAFVVGAAAGASLGILYAPDKGINTRDMLTYRLAKYRTWLMELLDELVDGRSLQENEARNEGNKVISDAKEKAESLLRDVEELMGQIKGKK